LIEPLLLLRAGTGLAVAWLLLCAYRWTRRKDPVLGAILAAGIIVRSVLGSLLFAISYFELPFLRSQQLGGGFWNLALDASAYFQAASNAAAQGLSTLPDDYPSLTFVRMLTVWMELVGVSPASAALLNLACYVLTAVLIVEGSRSVRAAAAVPLAAVTASPALIVFGTQALKDTLSVLLTVLAIVGVRRWADALNRTATSPRRDGVLGAVLLSAAVAGFAGMRAYYSLFIVIAVLLTALVSIAIAAGRPERLRTGAGYVALLSLLWLMFMANAGRDYSRFATLISATFGNPFAPVAMLDRARAGFTATGGATTHKESVGSEGVPPAATTGSRQLAAVPPGAAPTRVAPSGPPSAARRARRAAAAANAPTLLSRGSPQAAVTPPPDETGPNFGPDTQVTARRDGAGGDGLAARAIRTARGCAMLFIPISLLQALSIVSFSGGSGLLLITDIDTLVMDAAILGSLLVLFRTRQRGQSKPVVMFALVLAVFTTLSMAYVVTNFGTLFRLRLLAVTPIWVIPAFAAMSRGAARIEAHD
jgi:hypothetical protein